jgi:hypothetical protein
MPVHQERGNLADKIKYATKIFKNYWTANDAVLTVETIAKGRKPCATAILA